MFDWNGNGKIDDGDRAFEAYMIDKMNRETNEKDSFDDVDDSGDDYYLDDDEE